MTDKSKEKSAVTGAEKRADTSLKKLLDAIEQAAQQKPAAAGGAVAKAEADEAQSPAERVWSALKSLLGGAEGVPDEALADAVIAAWQSASERGKAAAARDAEPDGVSAGQLVEEPEKKRALFEGEAERAPMPIKSSAVGGADVDYDSMSGRQFRELKKKLKRAEAQGIRVRL